MRERESERVCGCVWKREKMNVRECVDACVWMWMP